MRKDRALAAFAARKCAEDFDDACPEIHRQRQNRAELNHDRVRLPKAVVQIEIQHRFDAPEMNG
jgi:hypothetical protein